MISVVFKRQSDVSSFPMTLGKKEHMNPGLLHSQSAMMRKMTAMGFFDMITIDARVAVQGVPAWRLPCYEFD